MTNYVYEIWNSYLNRQNKEEHLHRQLEDRQAVRLNGRRMDNSSNALCKRSNGTKELKYASMVMSAEL